jgi:hypothetical protein
MFQIKFSFKVQKTSIKLNIPIGVDKWYSWHMYYVNLNHLKFLLIDLKSFKKSSFLRNESFNMSYFCCPYLLFYGKTLKILANFKEFYKFCKLNF